ncbi:transmembrane protein 164-like isoform X1 [Pomacea canaliculata]|uniref:transmembrane protein 164-like isoform X1 n=1 Tax=Pomacea canaliculata TaxID=400727 RepID=UPI000D73F48C|nr:transmembrane protein 164-like isoform X1 [Pomacea canaliculata]XP_025078537.1 transmembrane protein 164-like isoform X1 [Pomacea canaliculata]
MDAVIAKVNSSWSHVLDWTYAGVDYSLPGNGGEDCARFLSPTQRLLESMLATLLGLLTMRLAYPKLTLPATKVRVLTEKETTWKRILLVLMCLTWGCELGFKFATRQMIWIFNPCHIATAVQIYLLAAGPSKAVTAVFRLHMHMLTGAPIAILFPVINTRLLPFETEVYYIQHVLMLVIPFYLMHLGDPYIPERLGDFSWAAMAGGLLFIYHFCPLQLLALHVHVPSVLVLAASLINLNNMLCPAVSDPFHGPYYRLYAMAHQIILIPSLGKIYAALARRLGWCPYEAESSIAILIKEEIDCMDVSSCQEENDKKKLNSSVSDCGIVEQNGSSKWQPEESFRLGDKDSETCMEELWHRKAISKLACDESDMNDSGTIEETPRNGHIKEKDH